MTPDRLAALLAVDALARDVPLAPELRSLGQPRAAQLSEQGRLGEALAALGLPPEICALATAWPKSAGPALRRFDRLPERTRFTLHLGQTLAYLGFVLAVQLLVSATLGRKVLPVLEAMSNDALVPNLLDVMPLGSAFALLLLLPGALWLLLGASGWARWPGWGRHLHRAREAALAAALRESNAPEAVRAQAQRHFRLLREPSLGQLDLDEIAAEESSAAERAMDRFLISVRVAGFVLLTLLALATLVAVYGSIARLAWLT